MNSNIGQRGFCGEWSGVDLLLLEHQDRNPLKVALAAAIMFHLVLFWWNIWPQGKALPVPPVKEKPFFVYKVKPIEKPLEKKPLRKEKTKRMPIPDPTPYEVEPVLMVVPDLEPPPLDLSGAATDDFEFAPAEPSMTPVAAPVRDYMATSVPVALKKVEPEYPRLARKAGVEGLVILEAVIRKEGYADRITVLRSPPGKFGFDSAAVKALRQWEFRPGEMHGQPVDVIMTLTVKFRLDK